MRSPRITPAAPSPAASILARMSDVEDRIREGETEGLIAAGTDALLPAGTAAVALWCAELRTAASDLRSLVGGDADPDGELYGTAMALDRAAIVLHALRHAPNLPVSEKDCLYHVADAIGEARKQHRAMGASETPAPRRRSLTLVR